MIKVMVVDDHELVRTGIKRILNDAPGIRVVAEAASGEEAILVASTKKPDVACRFNNQRSMIKDIAAP